MGAPRSWTRKSQHLETYNMKIADLIPLQEGIYELEKGHIESRLREANAFMIRFGSIETDLTPKKIEGDAEI